jgi:hypothetical protein
MKVVMVAGRSEAEDTRRQREEVQLCNEAGTLDVSCTHSVPVSRSVSLQTISPTWDGRLQ